jgi:hypothetical protein
MVLDLLGISGLAVRRESHHFVLAGIHPEPGVIRECGVEQTEGVREVDLANDLEILAVAERKRGRRPLAHTVHRQDRGALERRGIERARRMAEMVLGEEQLLAPVDAVAERFGHVVHEQALLEELLAYPDGQGLAERREAAWREREVRLQQPFEFEKGLVVERDPVDILGPHLREIQAEADGVHRKRRIVLLAREAFFLGRGDDLAVHDQRSRRVVVERRDTEHLHRHTL